MFIICLVLHLRYSLVGWNHNILDQHAFRQSQTAIGVYYLLQEGFKIDYLTPVLGRPWSIPMEFPIYQWIVTGLIAITNMPIDQAGRSVSLFFFYLSLFPLYSLLKLLSKDKYQRLLLLCFILVNPTYLFWSRTFMIESTALFFSLSYLYFVKKSY